MREDRLSAIKIRQVKVEVVFIISWTNIMSKKHSSDYAGLPIFLCYQKRAFKLKIFITIFYYNQLNYF